MNASARNIVQHFRLSSALWIPTLWFFFVSSRPPTLWLRFQMIGTRAEDQMEGSPVDRLILTLMILCALAILFTRGAKVAALLRTNLPILVFLAYCGVSVVWSDFPDVAFKRWFRGFGDVAMVMVVLTEASPPAAIKALFARMGFIILPLSILSDLGRGAIGRHYSNDFGKAYYNGVTTNKNLYGVIAMILGVAAVWRVLAARKIEDRRRRRREKMIYGGLSLLAMFCLWFANSGTSDGCFVLAVLTMWLASRWSRKKSKRLHFVVAALIFFAVYAALLNPNAGVVSAMGKDPTLTGRTAVWKTVIPMNPHPAIGAGFESFWLGQRLEQMWEIFPWKPNEAHNGYIEMYLNLGWTGLFLLGVIIIAAYVKVARGLATDPIATLRLAFLVVAIVYSLTEAGFRIFTPTWIMFLLTVMPAAGLRRQRTLGRRTPRRLQRWSEEEPEPVLAVDRVRSLDRKCLVEVAGLSSTTVLRPLTRGGYRANA